MTATDLPAPDAAAEDARRLVDGLVGEIGGSATLAEARQELILRIAALLINNVGDARQDERDECIEILAALFPPAHSAYAEVQEAIRRIHRRDTQP